MSALLSGIRGGARLRHADTNDRSGPESTGRVMGDSAPPDHINAAIPVPPPSPPAAQPSHEDDDFAPRHENRNSTDWYSGLAVDAHPAAAYAESASLEPTREEAEDETTELASPTAPVAEMAATTMNDGPDLDDVDLSKTLRVRTLYDYSSGSSFATDLGFKADVVLTVHPSKDPQGPWWYGTLGNGQAGWIPSNYVVECNGELRCLSIKLTCLGKQCRALYDYTANTAEELSFATGDTLLVVDQSEPDWWKVEKNDEILLVPASYVEILG
jgi:hypothetical protein